MCVAVILHRCPRHRPAKAVQNGLPSNTASDILLVFKFHSDRADSAAIVRLQKPIAGGGYNDTRIDSSIGKCVFKLPVHESWG